MIFLKYSSVAQSFRPSYFEFLNNERKDLNVKEHKHKQN